MCDTAVGSAGEAHTCAMIVTTVLGGPESKGPHALEVLVALSRYVIHRPHQSIAWDVQSAAQQDNEAISVYSEPSQGCT